MNADVLPALVSPAGTGIPDLKAHLVKRQGRVCWYERSDGVHEVFRVQIQKAGKIFDREYPAREVYPCNEDFGKTAWSYSDQEKAAECFYRLIRFEYE